MTIQLRLTLWYTALLGITLILFSVLVYYALSTNLDAQIKQDAQLQADEVSRFLKQQLDPDPSTLSSSFVIALDEEDFSLIFGLIKPPKPRLLAGSGDVQLFDVMTGRIYESTDNLITEALPVKAESREAVFANNTKFNNAQDENGIPLLVYSVPLTLGNKMLGLQIIQSTAPIEHALNQVSRYLVFGTAFSLVLAAIVGAYLARRALHPINTITSTANSITQTEDLGRRLIIPQDADEVGQLAITFNGMLDRIQRLFQTQERLIGDVSHELRTPLTTIQGNIELLQRMVNSDTQSNSSQAELMMETAQDILQEVEIEASRMGGLISDLLLLAQADSGELQLQDGVVEMDTLLLDVYRQTRRMVDHTKGENSLEIRLGGEDQALVRGDRERLRQLLLNLSENAVKYTPTGGVVTLGLINSDGWVQLYVQDTGIGISMQNQTHIFERFFRTDKARSRELGGSGLGLSIAQWIAQAHGGRIEVESETQLGSKFTVWLPEWRDSSTTTTNMVDIKQPITVM